MQDLQNKDFFLQQNLKNDDFFKDLKRNDFFFFPSNLNNKVYISCLIDGTGSMRDTIDQVKTKVMDMIKGLAKQYPNQFEIQLMFYYGTDAYK